MVEVRIFDKVMVVMTTEIRLVGCDLFHKQPEETILLYDGGCVWRFFNAGKPLNLIIQTSKS